PPASRTTAKRFIHAPSQLDGASGGFRLTRHAVLIAPPRPIAQAGRLKLRPVRCKPATAKLTGHAVTEAKSPEACATKDDVRAEIDRIDQALLNLFAERHRYVTRMAEIK